VPDEDDVSACAGLENCMLAVEDDSDDVDDVDEANEPVDACSDCCEW
jgi:hypothetical protein